MRLFTATLATETNTFSPLPTSIENYRESVFLRPGEHPADAPRMCTAPLFVGRKRAEEPPHVRLRDACGRRRKLSRGRGCGNGRSSRTCREDRKTKERGGTCTAREGWHCVALPAGTVP